MLGTGDTLAEVAATDSGQAFVAETVARHFVTSGGDVMHQPGETLGYPAEHEECGSYVMPPEKIQHAAGNVRSVERRCKDDGELVEELYLTFFSRMPGGEEKRKAAAFLAAKGSKRREAAEDLAWGMLNAIEFVSET